jgi:uncharacterized protein (DUF362 family)
MFESIAKNDFITIETLFESEKERTVSFLANVYKQPTLLKDKIRKVCSYILDDSQVISGKKILIKPNWVVHDRKENDEICLRTNEKVLLALIEILLDCKPLKIIIGDAPIQKCQWDKLLTPGFYVSLEKLHVAHAIPIIIKDFRRVTFDPDKNDLLKERNPISDYTIFNLGKESFLEPISSTKNNFRVTNYNPDRLAESHTVGMHKYCITNELFDADLVISVPKIKTHQKTGITAALKNLVGVNGDKDFLPHHRVGGTDNGGDCYPGKNILRRISEFAMDNAYRSQGQKKYWIWFYLSIALWKLSNPKNVHRIAAGWYGNDTTWRMVMDINKIVIYGKKDGTLSQDPQRMIFSLCDGIIGGQGDGPLDPEPLPLGIICFSNNSYLADICISTLMQFDSNKIYMIRQAVEHIKDQTYSISVNQVETKLEELINLSIKTLPPPGWSEYL